MNKILEQRTVTTVDFAALLPSAGNVAQQRPTMPTLYVVVAHPNIIQARLCLAYETGHIPGDWRLNSEYNYGMYQRCKFK